MRKGYIRRFASLMLSAVMVLCFIAADTPVHTAAQNVKSNNGFSYKKLDELLYSLLNLSDPATDGKNKYDFDENEKVRAIIVMDSAAAITLLDDGEELQGNAEVISETERLENNQSAMAERISNEVLDGKELDVVWNLTLAANAMSVNVEYGKLDDIKKLDGVKAVYIETRYEPLKADVTNVLAQEMTGASNVKWEKGYKGSGSKVAVIDTGTDTNHQSFDAEAFEYSLKLEAEAKGMSLEDYKKDLNLITKESIASVLGSLHAAEVYSEKGELSADDLYLTSKLPFAFNYVDNSLDVTHDNDEEGEHGSHVAGIAAANEFILTDKYPDFNGDGTFDNADAQALMNHIILGTDIEDEGKADINIDGEKTSYDVYLLLRYIKEYQETGKYHANGAYLTGVTGVAPNAQLITMKVFGQNGGAYTSDYMAAVEDAMLLGCDAINLSLGSPEPAFTSVHNFDGYTDVEYVSGILNDIEKTNSVLCIAAGNNGNWADYDDAYNLLYTDEGGVGNMGDPASYKNSFTIASADENGSITTVKNTFFNAGKTESVDFGYNESSGGVNALWTSLEKVKEEGSTYEAVFLGDPSSLFAGEEQSDTRIYAGSIDDFADYDFSGKIVFVSRGNAVAFSNKHMNAEAANAAAVVIYNNEDGEISASLAGDEASGTQGSTAKIPCITINLDNARRIFELCDKDENGVYTGTLTIKTGLFISRGEKDAATSMSSFSTWGPIGDLSLKPELTTPGGGIFSVNGSTEATDQYETMSGTSMATPHAAGLVALLSQYINEENVIETARAASGIENLTVRALIQSLLMSTAKPLIEADSGFEYSVRNQGAGLADITAAVNAESFVFVNGQDDGKVKAELGDGGENGWSFSFSINNLTEDKITYNLDASIITTDSVTEDGYTLTTDQMKELGADVSYSGDNVNGESVTVPAGGNALVTVTIKVTDEAAEGMKKAGFVNGFYVEGFIYAVPQNEDAVTHSIPVLGWYGNWSDPSMYDVGSVLDTIYETAERPSHIDSYFKNALLWAPAGQSEQRGYEYTGNIYSAYMQGYLLDGDSRYIEARNAVNSLGKGMMEFYAICPTLIRAAADFKIEIRNAETNELYFIDDYEEFDGVEFDDSLFPSFYYDSAGQWLDVTSNYVLGFEWDYTDLNGNPIDENTDIKVGIVCAPEYYQNIDGSVRWDELGRGSELSWKFRIDNTAPDITENGFTFENDILTYNIKDNNYIAAVILANGIGSEAVEYQYPDMDEDQRGNAVTGSFDLSEYRAQYGNKATVVICDYAGNETYYALNLGGEGSHYGEFLGFQYDPMDASLNTWSSFDEGVMSNETQIFIGDKSFVCAEYVAGYIFAQAEDGKMYAIPYKDMLSNKVDLESTYVAEMENVYQDIAYNYKDGKMYGIYNYADRYGTTVYINGFALIDDEDTDYVNEAFLDDADSYVTSRNDMTGLGLACDDNGVLYILAVETDDETGIDGTAHIWKAEPEEAFYGTFYGALTDAGDTGYNANYLQSMTWDHNTETLYWAQFYPSFIDTTAHLLRLYPDYVEDGIIKSYSAGTLSKETAGLIAPLRTSASEKDAHKNIPVFDTEKIGVPILNTTNLTMTVGGVQKLTYIMDPWYTSYKDVKWSSSNSKVASVDDNGVIAAVAAGSCTITVSSVKDPSLKSECSVNVASLSLEIEGFITQSSGGIGSVSDSLMYKFSMKDGVPGMSVNTPVTAPAEFDSFGLKLACSAYGRGSIWACEYGNTGMVYEIDPDTGIVKDVLEPIDGDMLFGLTYSGKTDMFSGIMNFYLFVDQPLTHDVYDKMSESYDDERLEWMWHKIDMSEYLDASQKNLVTNELGTTSIVFSAITTIDESYLFEDTYKDYLGDWAYGGSVNYVSDTTIAILDNVGRIWYIDEITGMTGESEWGEMTFMKESEEGTSYISASRNGVFYVECDCGECEEGTYNVFYIREIVETPLYDMFRQGTMPGITYHFSDMLYTTDEATGRGMFFMSLYDYWNEAASNELYLFVPGVGTGELDTDTWEEIKTPDALYDLGDTGFGNMIATINSAKLTGGLDLSVNTGNDGADTGNGGYAVHKSAVGPYHIGG